MFQKTIRPFHIFQKALKRFLKVIYCTQQLLVRENVVGFHNDPPLYKILVKVISDHFYCNPGISPDIKDFKFPAIIISVWYLHFR